MCHTYPYTFSYLQKFINHCSEDEYRKQFIRRKPLCLTIAGNE